MPSIPLHPRATTSSSKPLDNPLPQLLQTPSGLAILEIQGTINLPSSSSDEQDEPSPTPTDDDPAPPTTTTTFETPLGKLMFPDYSPQTTPDDDTSWMKRVYLYVGKYQRMTGEVKKLGQPVAVVQRRQDRPGEGGGCETEELEILDVVKYKMIFKNRPEPVNDSWVGLVLCLVDVFNHFLDEW